MILNHKVFGNSKNPAIIILHGLFGSSQNWNMICKTLSDKFHIYAVDCRNHGESFHNPSMTYKEMANDIINLMDNVSLQKTILIGHSMGGKISMACAQLFPDRIEKQIIIDISPKPYANHHESLIQALTGIRLNEYKSRSEVANALKTTIPNASLRQFLIKNISPKLPLKWCINLDGITKNYSQIMNWPNSLSNASYVSSLFIYGKKSNYVTTEDHKKIEQIFLNTTFKSLDASHWVHAEKPIETLQLIVEFIK